MNIQNEIKKIFAVILALTLIIIVILTLINGPTNYKEVQPFLMPLKEALQTTGNYFSGIAALGAAYIASLLFNDWKVNQHYINQIEISNSLHISITDFHKSVKTYTDLIWSSRFDPENTLMKQDDFWDDLSVKYEVLDDILKIFKINFAKYSDSKIDVRTVNQYLDDLVKALKNLHPFSLEKNTSGFIDNKHLEEYSNLVQMNKKLFILYKTKIRAPSLDILFNEALN